MLPSRITISYQYPKTLKHYSDFLASMVVNMISFIYTKWFYLILYFLLRKSMVYEIGLFMRIPPNSVQKVDLGI